jgi:hypothetical protein
MLSKQPARNKQQQALVSGLAYPPIKKMKAICSSETYSVFNWTTRRYMDGSVGTETGYGMDGWGSIPGKGKILFSTTFSPDLRAIQSLVQWIPWALSTGVKL